MTGLLTDSPDRNPTEKVCPGCGLTDDCHRLDCWTLEPPPYTGDEPLGTCPFHGDYWTDDCTRCGR